MKKCPYCAEEINDEAIKCKHCNSMLNAQKTVVKNKKEPSAVKIIVASLCSLLILYVIIKTVGNEKKNLYTPSSTASSDVANPSSQTPEASKRTTEKLPEDEQNFIKTVTSFIPLYKDATNDLKKSAVRTARKSRLQTLLTNKNVREWTGTVEQLMTDSDGNAAVKIKLNNSDIKITTSSSSLFGDDGTMIKHGSSLYNKVSSLNEDDKVKFEGHFLNDSRDYVKEMSVTEEGSMTDPEFLFKFSDIEKL